jgi:hypothetical protein
MQIVIVVILERRCPSQVNRRAVFAMPDSTRTKNVRQIAKIALQGRTPSLRDMSRQDCRHAANVHRASTQTPPARLLLTRVLHALRVVGVRLELLLARLVQVAST